MPITCYSYPADMPPGGTDTGTARVARRGLREMAHSCYSYPIMCFGFPDDVPWSVPSQDAVPSALRRMPATACFRY
jgi:hypothetical protein